MLTKIGFKNYKAFKEGTLEIKPITVLLGANSVGKTSLIQLFLMLQETALTEHYKSALKLYGGFFSLGEGINLFRKRDINNCFGLSIEYNNPQIATYLNQELFSRFTDEVLTSCYFLLSQFSKSKEDTKLLDQYLTNSRRYKTYPKELKLFISTKNEVVISKKTFFEIVNRASEQRSKIKDKSIIKDINTSFFFSKGRDSILDSILWSKEELLQTYEFLEQFSKFKHSDLVKLEYDFLYADGILKTKKFILSIGNIEKITIDFSKIKDINSFISFENSDNKIINKLSSQLVNSFDNSDTVFSFIKKDDASLSKNSIFGTFLLELLSFPIDKAEEAFQTQCINYVSPIRAYPKRYYFLDKAKTNIFLDTLDGEAIAEILKENYGLKEKVNSWFKKFNLQIDTGQLKDIIHRIVVRDNALDLDLTDVGFGVSQVLPVIIQGFLSKENSITLIEQPEIHLHPTMQADLADLFIEIAINKAGKSVNKYLIIETHSEYLLKRLRRRISENVISNDQVAIYCIEPQTKDEGAVLKRIDISQKGAFDWPKNYYSGDLADDITEFLKNQI